MNKIVLSVVVAGSLSLMFTGCVGNPYQAYQVTPEQQQQAMQQFNKMFGGKLGSQGVVQQQQQEEAKAEVQIPAITQDELKAKIEAFGVANSTVAFEKTKSGLNINGKSFSDYEGSIKEIGFDYVSGAVTYLAQISPDNYVMKYTQASSDKEPLTVGTVKFNNGTWQVRTVTGKNLTGDSLLIGSTGFILNRVDGTGFVYEHKVGIKSINVPSEYQVAKFQNGDVTGTRTILLEIPAVKEEDGIGNIFSKAKAIGSSFGLNKKEDYAFLNFNTGQLTKINIPNDGKSQHGECVTYDPQPYSKHVQKCLKYAPSEETLYDRKLGGNEKNSAHYFWRVRWFNSLEGVIALTQEDGLSKIYATNLSTNKKVLIGERVGGFVGYDATVTKDGKIKVVADKGILGTQVFDDVGELVKTLPAIVEKEETK